MASCVQVSKFEMKKLRFVKLKNSSDHQLIDETLIVDASGNLQSYNFQFAHDEENFSQTLKFIEFTFLHRERYLLVFSLLS